MKPLAATLLCLGLSVVALDAAQKDILVTTEGRRWEVIIYHEKADRLYFKTNPALPTMQDKRWAEVADITYAGMDGGYYQAGMDEMASGNYQNAAVRFGTMVTNGTREWETAYGLLRQGEALELAEQWGKAAEAYAAFTETLPEHRWYSDMLYRQGVALARSGSYQEANAIGDLLEARFKDPDIRDRGSQQRASCVRTAAAALQGKLSDAKAQSRRISLSKRDGPTYYHWTEFWAGLLMKTEEFDEAASVYRRVLEESSESPARAAGLALGLGLALAKDGESDEALATLIRLDALPYGSPKQRIVARYWIGRLMWETSQQRLGSDREQVAEYAKAQQEEARRLLDAVVNATISHPIKDDAQALLAKMPAAAE